MSNSGGGGGGGGGIVFLSGVTLNLSSFTVVVGAGGVGSASSGVNGAASSFGALAFADGGGG